LFFSFCALVIWVVWLSMHTGWPAQPARNVARLAPDFVPSFSLGALLMAAIATLTWAALVKWRISHHRAAIWKSLVLPAGGAVLCWLLLMSLWLPLLDHARSYAGMVNKIKETTGQASCLQYAGIGQAQGAALMFHGKVRLLSLQAPTADCAWLVMDSQNRSLLSEKIRQLGWVEHNSVWRLSDRNETLVIFKPATPAN
jgi:hypothetical protein